MSYLEVVYMFLTITHLLLPLGTTARCSRSRVYSEPVPWSTSYRGQVAMHALPQVGVGLSSVIMPSSGFA